MMSFTLQNSTYADQINATYHSDEDLFVTVDQRLQELYAKDSDLEMLFRSLAEGMVAAMGYETYDDMIKDIVGMGEIQYVPVTNIDINDTMQRWPDRENLIDIISEFASRDLSEKIKKDKSWIYENKNLKLFTIISMIIWVKINHQKSIQNINISLKQLIEES